MKRNSILHDIICLIYVEKGQYIKSIVIQALENLVDYETQIYKVNDRRKKDNSIL
jgi:hypothetical protein